MTNVRTLEKTFVGDEAIREQEKKSDGLCITCDHRGDCVFAGAEVQPVVFCEEFSDRVAGNVVERRDRGLRMDGTSEVTPMLRGLCLNCDNRDECVHEKPDVGISYCEDYV